MRSLRSVILWGALMPGTASAADLLVGPMRGITTIGEALSIAANGDRVIVDAGIYRERLFISNFTALTIQSASGDPTSVTIQPAGDLGGTNVIDVAASTVTLKNLTIDGGNTYRGILLYVSDLTLVNAIIQHGSNPDGYPGAGLDMWNNSSATIVQTAFYANQAAHPGGYMNYGGHIGVEVGCFVDILMGTTLSNGAAERGGGLWVDDGAYASVDSAQFFYNTAVGDGDNDGGAIYAGLYSILDVSSSEFDFNSAGNDPSSGGGAIFSTGEFSTISGGDFFGNDAYFGGAVAQELGTGITVESSWFGFNFATLGGGLACDGVTVCDLWDSTFEGNGADYGGGVFSSATTTFGSRNTWCFNDAAASNGGEGRGGAMYLEGGYYDLSANVILENTALLSGGGIYLSDGVLNSVNNHYLGNVANSSGGAIRAEQLYGMPTVVDSTNDLIAWNTAGVSGGGLSADALVAPSSSYDWFYANVPDSGRPFADVTSFVDIGNPMLRNYIPGVCEPLDLVPRVTSPLIDAGDPTLADLNGSRSDIGAFGGAEATPEILEDADGDGFPLIEDCDDDDPNVGAVLPYFEDLDLDGIGGEARIACEVPVGAVDDGGDCDDLDPAVGYGTPWWPDNDLDGYGDENGDGVESCEPPGDAWTDNGLDCDDTDPDLNPYTFWYADLDGDGWGVEDLWVKMCDPGEGYVAESGDCDDDNDNTFPGADEFCDEIDSDCDGSIDDPEALDMRTLYVDLDGDGFGDPDSPIEACRTRVGVVKDASDCDDTDPSIHPGAEEIWYDDIDQDCDGKSDFDQDLDGWDAADGDCDDSDPEVYPDAEESVDGGTDNNCDGVENATWMVGGGGCGCTSGASGSVGGLSLMLLLAVVRRRHH